MKLLVTLAAALLALPSLAFAQVSPSYAVYPGQSYCPQLTYNLYRGLNDAYTGGQVSQLQYFLGTYFAAEPVPVTGYFGSVTTSFVARFQREQSVYPITGGVGPLTRAAIARACGGTTPTPPSSGVFYLNAPFTLSAGAQAKEYQGQLDVTLNSIAQSGGSMWWWPWPVASSANVTLGLACAPGTYCFYYPQQTFDMTQGQSVTFQGYTLTLTALTQTSATFTASKAAAPSTPVLSSLSPSQGPVGTQVTVYGSGFVQGSVVHFGSGIIPNAAISSDGTRVTFTVPDYLNAACYYTQPYCLIASQPVTPGAYGVYVANQNGQSATQNFTVTSGTASGGVNVSSPATGQIYLRGGVLPISWESSIKVAGSVVLDLYSVSGSKVGTIAIQSYNGNGSYGWTVPTPNTICTMQYPNGLCGQSLSGQYFIKVSVVSGSGFDANPTVFASGNSGTFAIN